jgi:hypothetical protein
MTLPEKIMSIYPAITYQDFVPPTGTIFLQNDGDGDYIAKWEHPDYPRPTDEQLNAVEAK